MLRKIKVLAFVAALLACGQEDRTGPYVVSVESTQAWTHRADFVPRVQRLVRATQEHFGFSPSGMDGVLLVVNDEWPVSCPGATSRGTLVGCYHMGERVITVTAGWLEDKFVSSGQPCVENLAVPHEVLHAYIGDPQHSDPRWAKLTDIWYEYVLQEHPECYAFMAWRWW